jgi:hypothetical protein
MRQSEKAAPRGPAIRGRPFQKGNGGRKRGSKNRTSVIAAALVQGEAEELVRKAVELAKNGNIPMLKLLVSPFLSSSICRAWRLLMTRLRLSPQSR